MTAAPVQRTLLLPISAEAVLLSPGTVAAVTGWHVDAVEAASQSWRWVFDLGTGRRIVAEKRIWRRHVTGDAEGMTNEAVLAEIIGTDKGDVRGAFLETRWGVSGPTLHRLWAAQQFAGRVNGHTLWIERASLASFLNRRLIR